MNKLLIIGGGNMGYAIASGISTKKVFKNKDIIILESNPKRISFLKGKKFKVFKDITDLKSIKNIQTIIIAVKPKDINVLLSDLKPYISKNTLLLSIAAGIRISSIASILGQDTSIGRVMPNTPCQIGKGVNVLTFNKKVVPSQKKLTNKIFSAIGKTLELKEEKFDLVTALSGSGPAYFCLLIESLTKSGIKLGLDKKTALELALQTGLGTFEMLLTLKELTPETLRQMVTSPNGTTHAAITTLQKNDFEEIVFKAIKSAKDRSIALGRK